MQQIKIFPGMVVDPARLETDVNAWLAEESCRGVQLLSVAFPSSSPGPTPSTDARSAPFFLIVVYDKAP